MIFLEPIDCEEECNHKLMGPVNACIRQVGVTPDLIECINWLVDIYHLEDCSPCICYAIESRWGDVDFC